MIVAPPLEVLYLLLATNFKLIVSSCLGITVPAHLKKTSFSTSSLLIFPASSILHSLSTVTEKATSSACMKLRPIHARLAPEKLKNVPRVCRVLSDAITLLLAIEVIVLVQREGSIVYGDGHI